MVDLTESTGEEVYEIAADLERVDPAPADDMRYLKPQFAPLLHRHVEGVDLKGVDTAVEAAHMVDKTVLMFEIEDSGRTGQEMMVSRTLCMQSLRDGLNESRGEEVEDVLWVFDNPTDALRGALACRRTILANQRDPSSPQNTISGFGIHVGRMLFLQGTDVHWGDPVNTASKLGQDLATDGHILISEAAFNMMHPERDFGGVRFARVSLQRSGVQFDCYQA